MTYYDMTSCFPLRPPTYIIKQAGANRIAACSRPACSQAASGPASCCSRLAADSCSRWYRPTAYGPTDRPIAWAHL